MIPSRRVGAAIAAASVAVILGLTLRPSPSQASMVATTPFTCLLCGELGLSDVIDNTLLFIPLGLGLALAGTSRWRTTIACGLLSISIEALQWKAIPGRDASLSDILTNTTGGAIGAWMGVGWRGLVYPQPWGSRRLALGMSGLWVLMLGATAALLQPAPTAARYWGQWAAELPQFATFRGVVRGARLDDVPLPGHQLENTDWVRSRILAGTYHLEVRAESGPPTERLAPIFSIYDGEQHGILILGQDGRDLVYGARMTTSKVLLRGPVVRLANALPAGPGEYLRLEMLADQGTILLRARTNDTTTEHRWSLDPSWGWYFLYPFDRPVGTEGGVLGALWLAATILPAGYWSRRAQRFRGPRWWLAGAGWGMVPLVAVVVGVGLVHRFAGLPPIGWPGWLGGLGGIWVGRLLERWIPQEAPGR